MNPDPSASRHFVAPANLRAVKGLPRQPSLILLIHSCHSFTLRAFRLCHSLAVRSILVRPKHSHPTKIAIKTYLLTILAIVPFLLPSTNAQNLQQGSADIPNPHSIFRAQERPNWCWAACNQMLLNAVGIPQTQIEQATKRVQLFGGSIEQGAGGDYSQAAPCLKGNYTKADGQSLNVKPYASYLRQHNQTDPAVIIDALRNGVPVIMATTRHGRVCVGVDYVTNGAMIQITTLRLLNPAHGLWPVPKLDTVSMAQLLQEGLFGFMTFKKP